VAEVQLSGVGAAELEHSKASRYFLSSARSTHLWLAQLAENPVASDREICSWRAISLVESGDLFLANRLRISMAARAPGLEYCCSYMNTSFIYEYHMLSPPRRPALLRNDPLQVAPRRRDPAAESRFGDLICLVRIAAAPD